MRLILIRHAKAEERSATAYPDDALRPLSETGRREQAILARALKRMRITFDYLTASPKIRARETAEILSKGMKWKEPPEIVSVLGDGFSVTGVIEWLRQYPQEATVACVGHEPDLGELASALLSSDDSVWIDFKKSGILALDFNGYPTRGGGILLYFLRPKQLLLYTGKQ